MSSSSSNGVYVCELNLGSCSCEDRGSFDISTDVGQAEFANFSKTVEPGSVLLVALVGNTHNPTSQDSSTIASLVLLGGSWWPPNIADLTGYGACLIAVADGTMATRMTVSQLRFIDIAECDAVIIGKIITIAYHRIKKLPQ